LPVNTKHLEGAVRPFLHVDSFLVIDRHGLSPYLFSGNGGYPMKYFRYAHWPYAPDDDWYNSNGAVDWRQVGCSYDYLLVTKPYDPNRIGLSTTALAENASAVLLRVAKGSCESDARTQSPVAGATGLKSRISWISCAVARTINASLPPPHLFYWHQVSGSTIIY
jgi:hypothetical protein